MVIPLRDDNPTVRFPVVTVLLIVVNCFVYFALQPHGGAEESRFHATSTRPSRASCARRPR